MTEKPKLILSDPHHVKVDFVNQLINSGHSNGVVNMTLAVAQFTPTEDGEIVQDLTVASRLRFDLFCATQIRDALTAIIEQNIKPANGTAH